MTPTLLVMAAGVGSRYGGLKQIDPVGPNSETIIDYSIYDAVRAGFGKVVFVIRRDIEVLFREAIGRRFETRLPVEYVMQELDKLPAGFAPPPHRRKPWGTSHAILMGEEVVCEPFGVINADDFYGAESYRVLAEHLRSGSTDHAMVGFVLKYTLSEHGSVARGVCDADGEGYLRSIVEHTNVEKDNEGVRFTDADGDGHRLTGDERVSMNMWGFQPAVFSHLRRMLAEFLRRHGHSDKAEFFIPTAISTLITAGQARVKVLRTSSPWFGVTYKQDRPLVQVGIGHLIARGEYPGETVGMKLKHNVSVMGRHFQIHGEFIGAEPYGSGHINDTYCATYSQGSACVRYIHQRINHNVFKDAAALMNNIQRVTDHLHSKLRGLPDLTRRTLTVIPSRAGGSFYRDDHGNYWRTYIFIENARTYDAVESLLQAHQAAKAFGEFQRLLSDLPPPRLHDTIPEFHDTPKRFAALERAIETDAANRAPLAKPEIEFALRRKSITPALVNVGLPERVTHNDTKFNNVMLDDETQEGICVIDLDTVMPGLAPYDFGDMVRTTTSPAREDERDLSKVTMQFPMFEALVRGYLSTAGEFLTGAERAHLVLAGKLITFECGVRFLTDYLQGDVYFKVHRDGHNLDRCRTQFKLVESIEQQEERMNRFVGGV